MLKAFWISFSETTFITIRGGQNRQVQKEKRVELQIKEKKLFYSFFKSLVGKDVVVELKNDLSICGTLHSVDQYLNIKLTDISVTDPEKYPHMLSVKNCFIRGSVVRYVQLPADEVDTQLLQDAARKEAMQQKQ
uniref:U6 snRNA-associated Sm-like protein LSm2 n=1 Tax=Geotrypetes seraphini TaxID=260995 RepID=A0A6P8NB96_GEOSA|nr:U6 snRNA-associated Sm-like protein LSm2 isoform X1 [Geotrypetes seraphini]